VLSAPNQSVFIRVHLWLKTKTPPPVLAMGFDKFVERNQNPTAALRSSSAFASSRFRFKLQFTTRNLAKSAAMSNN
jgi:hypothetical protein